MSTTSQITLPFDILECIIEILAEKDDSHSHIQSLRHLSRTCKSMVPLARRHLFASVGLYKTDHCQRFCELVFNNPQIMLYMRHLIYTIDDPFTEHDSHVLELVKTQASYLRSVELWSPNNREWDRLPEPIRKSLEGLIQLPSVTHLDIQHLRNLPGNVLAACDGLVHLSMAGVTTKSLSLQTKSTERGPTSANILDLRVGADLLGALSSLVYTDTPFSYRTIIDFTHIKRVDFIVSSDEDLQIMMDFLEITRELESLEVSVDTDDVLLLGLGPSLMKQASRTLRRLRLDLVIDEDDYEPLHHVNTELNKIAGSNVLDTFELGVSVNSYSTCTGETEEWPILGSILSAPGAFPVLKHVSINITWSLCDFAPQGVLTDIREKHFSRLVEENGVELTTSEVHEFCPECGPPSSKLEETDIPLLQ